MKRPLALVALATLASAAFVLPIGPSGAGIDAGPGQAVYVVHGIPGDPVDVCIGDDPVPAIPNFEPGDVVGPIALPPGSYDISLHAVGADCDDLIYAETVAVPAGSSSIVAWTPEGPDLAVFPNEVECTEPGAGHITARHTAGAAGPVDVFANGGEVVSDLQPGEQATLFNVPVGTYSVEVRLDGSGTVVLGPADVQVVEGQNLVLHVVNALEEGGQPASVIPLVLTVGTCTTPVVPLAPSFTG